MGEAKRRKAAGQGYGAPRLEVEVSKITGKRLIVLRSKSRELVISPHASAESLNFGLSQCRRCLDSIPSEMWQSRSRRDCRGLGLGRWGGGC